MDGYEYVWVVTHAATHRICGIFVDAETARADEKARGKGHKVTGYRVWSQPIAGGLQVRLHESEPCGLCGGDGLARRMEFVGAHGASMRQVVLTNEPCPRCR